MTRLAIHDDPGYSRSKAAASGGRATVAPGWRAPPLLRPADGLSSRLDGDFEARMPQDACATHGIPEFGAAGERLRLLDAREPVQGEHLMLVTGVDQDLRIGAPVLLAQAFHRLVHRSPCADGQPADAAIAKAFFSVM